MSLFDLSPPSADFEVFLRHRPILLDTFPTNQTVSTPPTAYPDRPWERGENKGNLKPRHHVYYAIDYYSRPGQTLSQDSSS